MPAVIDKLNIHQHGTDEKLDRRIKFTAKEKEDIRNNYFKMHESERPTMTSLAAKYRVDRRLIQFILFPEREVRHRKQARIRHNDGRYYDKEKERLKMQRYRDYKRRLAKEGKLKNTEE